jgi:hypothetical protein
MIQEGPVASLDHFRRDFGLGFPRTHGWTKILTLRVVKN